MTETWRERQAATDIRLLRLLKQARKPLLAFSGGKDSLVLLHSIHRLGFDIPWVAVRTAELDWPQHLVYLEKHRAACPDARFVTTRHTIAWLSEHRKYLFPTDSRIRNEWFRMVQRSGCQGFARRYGADLLIWGRRDQENTVKADVYDLSGVLQAAPLRDWDTLDIWAYIFEHQLEVSPLYGLPNAQERGVHRWNTRRPCATEPDPWRTIAEYAPEVARAAVAHFPEVSQWLNCSA